MIKKLVLFSVDQTEMDKTVENSARSLLTTVFKVWKKITLS